LKKFLFPPKHLAFSLLFTLPLYSHIANSSPSTTGEGNLVTGKNSVKTGYNNTVTTTNGLTQTIAEKTAVEKEISNIDTKIEVNEKTQVYLNNIINKLTRIINQIGRKPVI